METAELAIVAMVTVETVGSTLRISVCACVFFNVLSPFMERFNKGGIVLHAVYRKFFLSQHVVKFAYHIIQIDIGTSSDQLLDNLQTALLCCQH